MRLADPIGTDGGSVAANVGSAIRLLEGMPRLDSRRRFFMRYALDGVAPETDGDDWWVAPSAVVIGNIKLERNASVWWNAVIRGDNELITIGENSNVQDGCVLHTDPGFPLTIGKDVTIGHLVMLHGCTIGDGSLVGIGSVILNNTRDRPRLSDRRQDDAGRRQGDSDNSLVMGSPGKVVRQITPEQAARMAAGAQHYVDNWRRYKKGLITQGKFLPALKALR